MKVQHYTAIAIRLMSLLLLLYALRLSLWLVSDMTWFNLSDNALLLYQLGPIILILVFGLIFWFLPMKLAKLIVKPVWDTEIAPFKAGSFLRVLIIFLGLYFVLDAILDIARFIFQLSFIGTPISPDFTLQLKTAYVVVGLQLIVGLFLIIKNYWITQELLKINTPEIAPNNNQDD